MYLPHECAPGLVVQPEWRGFRPLFDREAIEKPWEIEGKRALTKSFALNSTPAKKLGQSSRKVASVVKSDVKHRLPAFTLIKNSGPDLTAILGRQGIKGFLRCFSKRTSTTCHIFQN